MIKYRPLILFVFALAIGFTLSVSAFAQDMASVDPVKSVWGIPKPLFAQLVNILGGALITGLVSASKSSEWVSSHPKVVATILAIIGSIATGLLDVHASEGIAPYITTFAIQLTSAIGTFEIVKSKSANSA